MILTALVVIGCAYIGLSILGGVLLLVTKPEHNGVPIETYILSQIIRPNKDHK